MICSKELFSTTCVKVDSLEYKAGLVVCSTMEENMPIFCQISDILLVENPFFNNHYHAVSIVRKGELLKISEFKFHKQLYMQSLYNVSDLSLYIVP